MDNIRENIAKIKDSTHMVASEWVVLIALVLVGFVAFGLGRLSALEEGRVAVEVRESPLAAERPLAVGGLLVASQKGSKYHFPWCPGAKQMKESNKMWFDSETDARRAGYSPAGNCPGL